eukprot:TRINITY_DN13922_c0_g4_i1.p2 TRINITY_DN13922_c0_g4~~TRINITY_DN13922_c0_g4_i1.p2  ORF type:complete len:118 (-),score=17.33 TRINITY_DN13922_c0_g4_i1:416-769(-)
MRIPLTEKEKAIDTLLEEVKRCVIPTPISTTSSNIQLSRSNKNKCLHTHLKQASQGIGGQTLPETGTNQVEGSPEQMSLQPPEELGSPDGTNKGIGNLLKLQISIPHASELYCWIFA